MTIHTRLCEVLGIVHPIIQAGMATYVDPKLVAAVSNAGGLGLLGSLSRSVDELDEQITKIRALTDRPFGVNVVLAEPHDEKIELLVTRKVAVIATSWGDPSPVVARTRTTGIRVVHQVQTPREARRAVSAGVDAVIAQGSDGGGHIGRVGTMALVPAVVDVAGDTPVVAAGGIADGRGLAAALVLGAQGVLIGTRFLATTESTVAASWKQAILDAEVDDTVQTDLPDLVWGARWPGATARLLANDLAQRWAGRESEAQAHREEIGEQVKQAEQALKAQEFFLWGGQSAGLVHDLPSAGDLVRRIVDEAKAALGRMQNRQD